jgi:NADPH:quinone reductase-like Zn-dependent oxidoreductase
MKATTGTAGRVATPGENRDETASPAPRRQAMQAIVYTQYGSADVLRVEAVDRPAAADNEVLVRVRAAGLDRGTWHFMTGLPYLGRLAFGLRKPKRPVLGLEVAGTVAATGAGVTRFEVGDEVFGIGQGSFAQYTCARQDKLARKPANLSFEQAAIVGVSGQTALQALRDAGRVEAGQAVLIVGASGGVGTFAVQIAKALGAEVTAVCRAAKIDLVRSIGADHVIDYTREDYADGPQRYDLILDIGGNSPLSRLRRALTPKGTLVIVGGEDNGRWTGMSRQLRALVLSPLLRQRLTLLLTKQRHTDLERLAQLIEADEITPVVDRTYPLAEMPDAMRHLIAGHARGKIAIAI